MIQYVIYGNPIDYPGRFVVRRWRMTDTQPRKFRPDPNLMTNCATLEEARVAVQQADPNLVCIQRCENDDPSIVEVWL